MYGYGTSGGEIPEGYLNVVLPDGNKKEVMYVGISSCMRSDEGVGAIVMYVNNVSMRAATEHVRILHTHAYIQTHANAHK